MRIQIPKVVRALCLGEYAPEYGEARLMVHVNPARATLEQWEELADELATTRGEISDALKNNEPDVVRIKAQSLAKAGERMAALMAQLWSQDVSVETHISADEVMTLITESHEHDPGLYPWLVRRTMEMVNAYREGKKKA